jgi:hypothetical protein
MKKILGILLLAITLCSGITVLAQKPTMQKNNSAGDSHGRRHHRRHHRRWHKRHGDMHKNGNKNH